MFIFYFGLNNVHFYELQIFLGVKHILFYLYSIYNFAFKIISESNLEGGLKFGNSFSYWDFINFLIFIFQYTGSHHIIMLFYGINLKTIFYYVSVVLK